MFQKVCGAVSQQFLVESYPKLKLNVMVLSQGDMDVAVGQGRISCEA